MEEGWRRLVMDPPFLCVRMYFWWFDMRNFVVIINSFFPEGHTWKSSSDVLVTVPCYNNILISPVAQTSSHGDQPRAIRIHCWWVRSWISSCMDHHNTSRDSKQESHIEAVEARHPSGTVDGTTGDTENIHIVVDCLQEIFSCQLVPSVE